MPSILHSQEELNNFSKASVANSTTRLYVTYYTYCIYMVRQHVLSYGARHTIGSLRCVPMGVGVLIKPFPGAMCGRHTLVIWTKYRTRAIVNKRFEEASEIGDSVHQMLNLNLYGIRPHASKHATECATVKH